MNDITKPEATEVAVVSHAPSIAQVLIAAASNPDMDAAKLTVLFDIKQRWEEEQARESFNEELSRLQGEMQAVVKDAANSQTHSKYARLDAIQTMLQPLLSGHGFTLTFDLATVGEQVSVTGLLARGKHEKRYGPVIAGTDREGAKGNVNKTELHGFGSTRSYLQRYLTCSIFNIPLANEDDDGNSGQRMGARARASDGMITLDQVDQIKDLLDKTKSDLAKFLGYYRIDRVENMTQVAAQSALRVLTDKLRANQAPPESKSEPKPDTPAKATRKRAQPPAPDTAQPDGRADPPQQAAAGGDAPGSFEAFLLDEWGETIRDDSFTDVMQYVRALMGLWEKSQNRETLLQQNADGIQDAMGVPAAATILAAMKDVPPPSPEKPAPPAIDPDRVEMARWVRGLKDAKTPDEVDTLGRNPALGNVAARWRSEGKTALVAELQKAFNDHKAELKAGAGA